MADYYPLLASVVAALETNSAEARRQLYDSARVGFPDYIGHLDPKLSDSEVTRERTALEEAKEMTVAPGFERVTLAS